MAKELKDCVAVVTGAASGIGKAITLTLANAGAAVALVGRDHARLDIVVNELEALGASCAAFTCDLGDDSQISALYEALQRWRQSVDILVHSAGAIHLGPLESAPVSDLDHQYRINLRAPYLLTQRLLPALRAAKGQVVFINSSVSVRVKEHVGAYTATKHGLKALADTLRMEVNPAGVRVLSVFPGNTATPMQNAIQKHSGRQVDPAYFLQPDDVAAVVLQSLLLPRTAEVTDIHVRPFRKAP